MADSRWLERRSQTWYVVLEVPPSLRPVLGRRLKRSLKTRDLDVARARRYGVLDEFHRTIARARTATPDTDPILQEAASYRSHLEDLRTRKPTGTPQRPTGDPDLDATPLEFLEDQIRDRAEALHYGGEPDIANAFYGLAMGTATPLMHHVDAWLSEGGTKGPTRPKTQDEYRAEVRKLSEWLHRERLGVTVQAVTRRVAGRYVSEVLMKSGTEAATNKKKVTSLSSYWAWLVKRGVLEDDGMRSPWAGQSPVKVHRGLEDDDRERPFTDDELVTLLTGPASRTLLEFMKVAALTGMRREEIGQLKVQDCAGGSFRVRGGKTASARRSVPIHPDLGGIVATRTKDKPPAAWLFPELTGPQDKRSDPIGKLFTRYRRGLGVQDGERRRSLVNAHSFRRWFVTKARGVADLAVVQAIVGHRPDSLTDAVYSGGPTEEAKRACVEAVRLPS